MEWTADVIESPQRNDNVCPDTSDLGSRLSDIIEETWIEFCELLTPDKAVPLD